MNLEDQRARRLSFATARELCLYFQRNQTRASYCAIGLMYPTALGLQASQVDQRHRAVGNLHELGGFLYEQGLKVGIDEAKLAEVVSPIWDELLAQAFPTEAEVNKEMGNF